MTHLSNLDTLEIEDEALEMMPESVAREESVLPVSFHADRFRVVIPTNANADKLVERLEFILNLAVTADTADRDLIDAAVRFVYPQRFAAIDNCEPRFRFKCPKQWSELERSNQETVRFCHVCQKNVFLCETEREANQHAQLGHCVAFINFRIESLGLLDYEDEATDSSQQF